MKSSIDGKTRLICLLGNPVSHSLSPLMQNYALMKQKINAAYIAFNLKENELEKAIIGLKALNFIGGNITIPYKERVIKYLDKLDELAGRIGAVNTIMNKKGCLIGYNTDGLAAIELIKQKIGKLENKRVLLLGAGGVSRAILYYLTTSGAEISIFNRTRDKAIKLIEDLKEKFQKKIMCELVDFQKLKTVTQSTDIIINATSVGMWPNTDQSPITEDYLSSKPLVFDTVYNPLETKLLRIAGNKCCKTIQGYKMLVKQGVLSFKIWFNKEPPIVDMEKLVYEKLKFMEVASNDKKS
jgi:shikimate dehydrogenase